MADFRTEGRGCSNMTGRLIQLSFAALISSNEMAQAQGVDPFLGTFEVDRLELTVEKTCYESTQTYSLVGDGRFAYLEVISGERTDRANGFLQAHEVRMAVEELLESGFLSQSNHVKQYSFIIESTAGRFMAPAATSGCGLVITLSSPVLIKRVEYESIEYGPKRLLQRLEEVPVSATSDPPNRGAKMPGSLERE